MASGVLHDGRVTGGRIIHPRGAPFTLVVECYRNTGTVEVPVWSPRDMTGATASLWLGATQTTSLNPVVSGADDNVVTLSLSVAQVASASGSVWEIKTASGLGVLGGVWEWSGPGETQPATANMIASGNRVIVRSSSDSVQVLAAESVMPAASILTELLTVDGAGSGLDADLLDGQHASNFATAAALTAESLARSTQDGVLSTAISAEATARAAAITAEASARDAADTALDGRVDAVEATATAQAVTLRRQSRAPWSKDTRPVYCDQYWSHFLGVGMPAAHATIGFSTIATAPTQWGNTFTVADASFWVAGQSLTIAAGTAQQQVVIVTSIASNTVTISGRVAHAWAPGTRVRPTWQNDSHPYSPDGYDALAWSIAHARTAVAEPADIVIAANDMTGTYTDALGKTNCPVGWESIDANVSYISTIWTNSANPHGRSGTVPYLATTATNAGARTVAPIAVTPGESIRVALQCKVQGGVPRLAVHDKTTGALIVSTDLGGSSLPAALTWQRSSIVTLPLVVPIGTTQLEIRLTSTSGVVQVYFDDLIVTRMADHAASDGWVIDRTDLPIVVLGDSWGVALAAPLATALTARQGSTVSVISASVSGQRLDQMVARFAADVAVHQPGTVLIVYGANDLAQGRSQALMEADADAVIAACRAIGARPVMLGIPPITSVLSTAVVRNDHIRARALRHAV